MTIKKRQNKFVLVFLALIFLNYTCAQSKSATVDIPLNNASPLTIEWAHRFVKIQEITWLHVNSLKTKAFVEIPALQAERGTVSI